MMPRTVAIVFSEQDDWAVARRMGKGDLLVPIIFVEGLAWGEAASDLLESRIASAVKAAVMEWRRVKGRLPTTPPTSPPPPPESQE